MPKYLAVANYTQVGLKGLIQEGGTGRVAAVKKLAESVGGTLESMYYAFGENDVYIILDVPDEVSMAAIALTVSAAGSATVKTTVLLSPEEIDAAGKKSPSYRLPGQ